jgi:hypothetical protein
VVVWLAMATRTMCWVRFSRRREGEELYCEEKGVVAVAEEAIERTSHTETMKTLHKMAFWCCSCLRLVSLLLYIWKCTAVLRQKKRRKCREDVTERSDRVKNAVTLEMRPTPPFPLKCPLRFFFFFFSTADVTLSSTTLSTAQLLYFSRIFQLL